MNKLLGKLGNFLLVYVLVFTQSFSQIAMAREEGPLPPKTEQAADVQSFKINAAQVEHLVELCRNKTLTEIQAIEDATIRIACTNFMNESKAAGTVSTGDADCVDCDSKMAQSKNSLGLAHSNLGDLAKVTGETTPEGSKAVCSSKPQTTSQCLGDIGCAVSPFGCPGYQGNSCIATLFQGIFQSLKSTWDGLKFVGKAIGNGIWDGGKKMVSWFSNSDQKKLENESANRAHIAAQAKKSEIDLEKNKKGEGFLAMAKRMAVQIWDSIWKSAQETFACEKWAGAPQLSKCLEHSASWDCASCSNKANLVCGVGGYLLSEILVVSAGMGLAVKGTVGAFKGGKYLARASNIAIYKAAKDGSKLANIVRSVQKSGAAGLKATGNGLKAAGNAIVKPGRMLVTSVKKGAKDGSKIAKAAKFTGDSAKFLASGGIKIVGTVAKVPLKFLQYLANIPGIKQYVNWSDKAFSWGRNLSWGKKAEAALRAGRTIEVQAGKIGDSADVIIHTPGQEPVLVKNGIERVDELAEGLGKGQKNASVEGRTIEGGIEVAENAPIKLNITDEKFKLLKNDKDFAPLINKFDSVDDQKMVAEIIEQMKGPNYVSPSKGRKLSSAKEVAAEADEIIRKSCPIK